MKDGEKRVFRFDGIEIDVDNLRVTVHEEVRALEPKSFRLLVFLVENPGRVLNKEKIMEAVWPDAFVSDNSLARAITQIRKVLEDNSKTPKYVETVPSVGYRFIGKLMDGGDTSPGPVDLPRRANLRVLLGCCLAAVAAAGTGWVVVHRSSPGAYPMRVTRVSKVTSYPGDEREPAISPDGSFVAFSWSGPAGDNYDIYVVQAGGQPPLRLTRDLAPDSFPAWSPDGRQIAFIRRAGDTADLIVVPPLGGPERLLHRFSRVGVDLDFTQHPVLSWSQDGKWIVFSGQSGPGRKYQLFLLSNDTGEVRAITSPQEDVSGDSSPALSGDARWLAFVRYLAPRNGRLLIQPLGPEMVARGNAVEAPNTRGAVHSPFWLEDGEQLLFTDNNGIFQWDRKRGTAQVYAASGVLGGMSVGPRKGNSRQVVVANQKNDVDIFSIALDAEGKKAAGPPQVMLRSTEWDSHPDYSPDGKQVVFISGRSGAPEVWVCDADGSNMRQLTHLGAHVISYPKWSPDGARIAFHARVPDVAEVYVVDVKQGASRQVTHHNPGLALATWSNDGRFLYASTLVGGTAVTHRFPAEGGAIERLWTGDLVRESVDGKYVLYKKSNAPGIFRRTLDGGVAGNREELLVADFWPVGQLGGYAPVAGGIYYVSGNAQGKPGPFRYFDYGLRRSIDVAPAVAGLERGFTVSPDRRRMLFAAVGEVGGDLISLEVR